MLSSEKRPYLRTYDEPGDVETVFEISDFRPLRMEYHPDERGIRKRYEEPSSTVQVMALLDGRFAVPVVRHYEPGPEGVHTSRVDYYAVDLKTADTYDLGRDALPEDVVDRLFLMTDKHQVLIENGRIALIH